MTINDFLGYKLICKMSKDLKDDPYYSDKEFDIVFSKDDTSDSGYTAIVSGTNLENEYFENSWDGDIVAKNILFGTWDIKNKVKL